MSLVMSILPNLKSFNINGENSLLIKQFNESIAFSKSLYPSILFTQVYSSINRLGLTTNDSL